MVELRLTDEFSDWFTNLRDLKALDKIRIRLRRMSLGNLGDVAPVGEGVSEARIHHGPGYRLYFAARGRQVIILLCGGDKSSQKRDIARAKQMAKEF